MAATMRAAVFDGPGRPLAVRDVPVPEPGPLEMRVRVETCGVCLSDVHLLDGTLPVAQMPVIPGHEAFGVVDAVGELISGWAPGDRVVLMGGRPCGGCTRCRGGLFEDCLAPQVMGFAYDGAWAEYVVVPAHAAAAVPEGVPAEHAAILADAVSTPYAALSETAALRPAEAIGLWGIGGLGVHAVQIARLLGAGLIVAVDPREAARRRALDLGADLALDPADPGLAAAVWDATRGDGLHVAMDLVGSNSVLRQAVGCLRRGGRLVIVGLSAEPIQLGPSALFGFQSHALLGHLGYRKRHLEELVTLLASGRLDLTASISDVLPLEDVAEGVRRLAEKDGDPVRILVRPSLHP